MPSATATPASRAGRMGVSRLNATLRRGTARAAVAEKVAAKGPFRRPEGTPNSLPLPPARAAVVTPEEREAAAQAWVERMMADVTWEVRPASTEPVTVASGSRMHSEVETVYPRFGPAMYRHGWMTFPQRPTGNRGPEGGIEYSQYRKQYPPISEIISWGNQFPNANVAVMLGEISHWSFAIDVDVHDETVCRRIRDLMLEYLGPIEMIRFGEEPKFIALFRTDGANKLRKSSYTLNLPPDYRGSASTLEILGHDAVFTAYGHHHRTGDYFKWGAVQPLMATPLDLTLVTHDQINRFVRAVHAEYPFTRAPRGGSQGCPLDPDESVEYDAGDIVGALLPRLPLDGREWTSEDGRVVDGRHKWILAHTMALVCGNAELVRAGQAEALIASVRQRVMAALDHDGGDQWARYLKDARSTVQKFESGGLSPWYVARRADGTAVRPARHVGVEALDDALSWLGRHDPIGAGPASVRGAAHRPSIKSIPVGDNSAEACARRRAERSLLLDRTSVHAIVVGRVVSARDAWIREMESGGTKVIVSGGPTGAGKTTTTLDEKLMQYLIANPRFVDGVDRGPLLYLAPTLANLSEAAAAAGRAGVVIHNGDGKDKDDRKLLEGLAADARAMGVTAVPWAGKGESNCKRSEEMELLNDAGLSTAGLCRQRISQEEQEHSDSNAKFVDCHWWKMGLCDYQKMKEAAKTADIIFLSHYWLTAGVLPTELQFARALVIDESVLFRVAQASILPRTAFTDRREPPRMDSQELRELDAKFHGEARTRAIRAWEQRHLDDRDAAATLAWKAMHAGQDAAAAFASAEGGLKLLDAAIRVTTDGLKMRGAIFPWMSLPEVKARCEKPMPPHVRMERRYWIILRDRAKAILADRGVRQRNLDLQRIWARVRPDGTHEDLRPTPTLDAKGEPRRDMRLQRLMQPAPEGGTVEGVRVSWRATLNWGSVPTLLLDASADEAIIGCLFPGRTVEMHRPEEGSVTLNVRTVLVADGTYSTSAMVPTTIKGDVEADKKRKGLADQRRAGLGKLADLMAAAHGRERCLFGAAKKVREMLQAYMREWPNVDWVHFGAQRGLDFAKGHAAALSVGRSEMPVWLVDGIVAALTWDAAEPEEPFDKRGDGTVDGKKPLMRVPRMRLVRMRDGRDLELVVPVMPGEMAARVDRQWREEELSQFRGRLRPVFRQGAATWVHVSSVIPEGVIADEILTLDEAVALWSPVLATVPGMLGVVSPVETARLVGVPVAEVEAFIAARADDPSWRSLTWSEAGVTRHGLLAAWVSDPAVAIGMSGIADNAIVGDLRAPMVPSGIRAPDAVELSRPSGATLAAAERGFSAHWAASGDGDREAARVAWVRERLDAPPPEPEVPAEPEPDDDEAPAPALDDVGWADDDAPLLLASWLDATWSPDALAG